MKAYTSVKWRWFRRDRSLFIVWRGEGSGEFCCVTINFTWPPLGSVVFWWSPHGSQYFIVPLLNSVGNDWFPSVPPENSTDSPKALQLPHPPPPPIPCNKKRTGLLLLSNFFEYFLILYFQSQRHYVTTMTNLLYFVQLLNYLSVLEETSHLKLKTIPYHLEFICV